jgi:hypothetical protein
MRIFLFLLVVGWLAMMPFIIIKQPWALRMRDQIKKGLMIYVIVMILAAVISLILRWDQIYG